MNTYKGNLHATVLSVLKEQELEQKKLNAQLNASLFSHYYLQGDVIVAQENLKITNQEFETKHSINKQLVNISNISNNLLDYARQEKNDVDQAITNTAVAAGNVQVAANAILKLTSDIASVFSRIKAEDFGDAVEQLASEANDLMVITAYDAEKTSLLAMNASSSTAKISSNTVFEKANATNILVEKLFKIIVSELEEVSNRITTDNVLIGQTKRKEEKAKGNLKTSVINLSTAELAYFKNNKELNLNLRILEKADANDRYSVSFDTIKSPFKKANQPISNPVEKYFIFLVKEKNKNIFNLNSAEQIVSKGTNNKDFKEIKEFDDSVELSITIKALNDTDGEKLQLGEQYVIIVYAIYKTVYKKYINNFEDFLSIPSLSFSLAHSLIGPDIKTFDIQEERIITPLNETIETTFSFIIQTKTNPDISVIYRCMFLPNYIARQYQYQEKNIEKPYFNLLLAEQVSSGNFIEASLKKDTTKKGEVNTAMYVAKLGAESTDVYGNIMVKGNRYTPVVLTIPLVKPHFLGEYTNAVSNPTNTKSFVFQKWKD
ncbi:hypothetical protein [Lacinutrix cladophorae]